MDADFKFSVYTIFLTVSFQDLHGFSLKELNVMLKDEKELPVLPH